MTKTLIAAALMTLVSSAAMAVTYPDSVTQALTLVPDDTDPTIAYATVDTRQLNAGQSFNDYITFHLSSVSDVSFSVTSDALLNAQGTVTLKLASFDSIKLNGPNDFMGSGSIAMSGNHASLGFTKLAAGDYTITLLGESVGKSGGNYYGNLSATAAVPEPEALALMLGGLGVVGVMSRRRKVN